MNDRCFADCDEFDSDEDVDRVPDEALPTVEDLPECTGDMTCYSCGCGRLIECGDNVNGSEVLECRECGEKQVTPYLNQ